MIHRVGLFATRLKHATIDYIFYILYIIYDATLQASQDSISSHIERAIRWIFALNLALCTKPKEAVDYFSTHSIMIDFISCTQSYAASKKGDVGRGKFLGNISLTMIVIGLVFGLLWFLIGMLIFAIFLGRLVYCAPDRTEVCNRIF